MTKVVNVSAKTLLGLLLGCCITNLSCSQERNSPAAFDVTRRHVEVIPAGTVIGDGPPRGWSNLIVKSHPRVPRGT